MKTYLSNRNAFTLVELLIVIALIAILSVAVLATINPIEQTNKARDAKFKNDASEVLSAYERYYASNNKYPWNVVVNLAGTQTPALQKYVTGGTDPSFGVIGPAGFVNGVGSTDGALIVSSELKSSFTGKEPFLQNAPVIDQFYMFHNGADSNYVCFCPKATANKSGPNQATLKCLDVVGNDLLNIGDNNARGTCNTDPTTAFNCTPNVAYANMVCVPDGAVSN